MASSPEGHSTMNSQKDSTAKVMISTWKFI